MKNNDLILLALAAAAVFFIAKKFAPTARAAPVPPLKQPNFIDEIFNSALPGQPGYGYNYYDNGTVIDGSGNYYYQGNLVWSPSTAAAGKY